MGGWLHFKNLQEFSLSLTVSRSIHITNRTNTIRQKDGLQDTSRNRFTLLIFQWLPLAETSHFRYGMIMG